MFKKIPIVATPIPLKDLFWAGMPRLNRLGSQEELLGIFRDYLGAKYAFLFNSATSSIFVALSALKKISGKNEVVLPAYTASSLVIAIKKAGLKPVLCDISLRGFNMDFDLLPELVSGNTLAILGVHLFGIVADKLPALKSQYPDIFVVEDCAQALGSTLADKPVGGLGEVSFFSFNRGKNLPTYAGGCLLTSRQDLAAEISACARMSRAVSFAGQISTSLKIYALSLIVRPFIYAWAYYLVCRFKDSPSAKDFVVQGYSDFQASVALSLLKRIADFSQIRYAHGIKLIKGLSGKEGIILPYIPAHTRPAFNRFPILCKELRQRDQVKKALWKAGIESSLMYLEPLHHLFELGYKKEEFPNAVYFAEHLLTLPVHPLVNDRDLNRMIDIIRSIAA